MRKCVISGFFISAVMAGSGCAGMESLSSIGGLNVSGLPGSDNLSAPEFEGVDVKSGLSAATDAYKAFTLSDEEVKAMALRFAEHSDTTNKVLPADNDYSKRLARLTNPYKKIDGLNLNYRVYKNSDVNAFSLADGTIRVYSGLMDLMTDDELLSVIGHEIGHVKLGHSKQQLQIAYGASAAKNAALSATGGASEIARLSTAVVGDLFDSFLNASYSQSHEFESDEYSFHFLNNNKINLNAAPSALFKLGELGGEHGLLSSHPDPTERAERLIKKKEEILKNPPALEKAAVVETSEVAPVEAEEPEVVLHEGRIKLPGSDRTKREKEEEEEEETLSDPVVEAIDLEDGVPGNVIREQNWRLRIGWYIDAGSYNDLLDAQVRAGQFKRKSSGVNVVPVNYQGNRFHMVLVGPYYAKDYAAQNRSELFEGKENPRLVYIGK